MPRTTPTERYDHDVKGMPVFAAAVPVAILLGADSMANAVPGDPEHCAIAEGCRVQLQTPHVDVGRYRTDLAMPHPRGVVKRGYGGTKWAVIRFRNPASARRVVIAADLGRLNGSGVVVELMPPHKNECPAAKRVRNRNRVDTGRGETYSRNTRNVGRGQDALTLLGVRNLNGQRRR